jgi:hypothetical protein
MSIENALTMTSHHVITFKNYTLNLCRDSSVGIAIGYGLEDRMIGVQFPAGAGNFSLRHRVQTGSGAHPASYSMGIGGSFLEVKRPRREANHSPPSSAKVKGFIELYLHYPKCLHGVVLS